MVWRADRRVGCGIGAGYSSLGTKCYVAVCQYDSALNRSDASWRANVGPRRLVPLRPPPPPPAKSPSPASSWAFGARRLEAEEADVGGALSSPLLGSAGGPAGGAVAAEAAAGDAHGSALGVASDAPKGVVEGDVGEQGQGQQRTSRALVAAAAHGVQGVAAAVLPPQQQAAARLPQQAHGPAAGAAHRQHQHGQQQQQQGLQRQARVLPDDVQRQLQRQQQERLQRRGRALPLGGGGGGGGALPALAAAGGHGHGGMVGAGQARQPGRHGSVKEGPQHIRPAKPADRAGEGGRRGGPRQQQARPVE